MNEFSLTGTYLSAVALMVNLPLVLGGTGTFVGSCGRMTISG